MKEKNYEKIQFIDAIAEAKSKGEVDYWIYSDYFGLCKDFRGVDEIEFTFDDKEISTRDLYIKKGAIYRPWSELTIKEIPKLFSLKICKRKEEYEYFDRYGKLASVRNYYRRTEKPISKENEVKVLLKEIKLGIGQKVRKYDSRKGYYYEFEGWQETFTSETLEKLNHSVWKVPKDYVGISANFALLKVGDLICRFDVGTYKITEFYGEPNKKKILFKAESVYNGKKLEIFEGSKEIYEVPYLEYPSELTQFNEMLNENALRPYVVSNDHVYNIYWLPIEGASQYIVSLYKYITEKNSSKLYHLQDVCVDRNSRYLALDKLAGNSYIITVSAENRNGEVIAKSRGIQNSGSPKFW